VLVLAVGAAGTGAAGKPSIILAHALPSLVRVGDTITVRGQVRGVAPGTRAALEIKRIGPWSVLVHAKLRPGGAFTLRWSVARADTGPVLFRVTALRAGKLLATTVPVQAGVGPAPVYCAPPVPPAVDILPGEGWIVGGAYLAGGAYPGIYECEGQPYTVTAINQSGVAVASQQVLGRHSYTLVVPAGSYTLKATPCGMGSASVTAGKQTVADAVCPVP
jgi:hypothetical protein